MPQVMVPLDLEIGQRFRLGEGLGCGMFVVLDVGTFKT